MAADIMQTPRVAAVVTPVAGRAKTGQDNLFSNERNNRTTNIVSENEAKK